VYVFQCREDTWNTLQSLRSAPLRSVRHAGHGSSLLARRLSVTRLPVRPSAVVIILMRCLLMWCSRLAGLGEMPLFRCEGQAQWQSVVMTDVKWLFYVHLCGPLTSAFEVCGRSWSEGLGDSPQWSPGAEPLGTAGILPPNLCFGLPPFLPISTTPVTMARLRRVLSPLLYYCSFVNDSDVVWSTCSAWFTSCSMLSPNWKFRATVAFVFRHVSGHLHLPVVALLISKITPLRGPQNHKCTSVLVAKIKLTAASIKDWTNFVSILWKVNYLSF